MEGMPQTDLKKDFDTMKVVAKGVFRQRDHSPTRLRGSAKLDFPSYRVGIQTQLLLPLYSDVIKYLVRIRSNLQHLLGVESECDKYGGGLGMRLDDEEMSTLLSQTIEDVDVSLTQLFQNKDMDVPTYAAVQSLDYQMRTELTKAQAVDDVWAETVSYIRDNYSRRDVEREERRVTMSLEEKNARQSHFGNSWISGNMCTIVNRFSPDRLNGDKMREILAGIGHWGMDVFELDKVSNQRPLVCVAYATFCQHDLFHRFQIPKEVFVHFFSEVERSYHRGNSFHNSVHAADVMQTVNVLLGAEKLQTTFTDLEIMVLLFSAAVHDVDHPGVSNIYLVTSQSPLAAVYNDHSILEQHHITKTFQLLQQPGCDLFQNVSQRQRYLIGKNTKKILMTTDMSQHTAVLATLATKLDKFRRTSDLSADDRGEIMAVMCHVADLSYPAKPVHIYNIWVDRFSSELFQQGDLERSHGHKISPLCDRYSLNCKNIPKAQIGFIDFVVGPLFDAWGKFVEPDGQMFLEHLEENRSFYNSGSIVHDQFQSAHEKENQAELKWFAEKSDSQPEWTYKSMVRNYFNEYPIQFIWGEIRGMSPNMKIFAITWIIAIVGVAIFIMAKTNETIRCLSPGAISAKKSLEQGNWFGKKE